MSKFEEELKALIRQAYDAGYLHAAWSDGANISNEDWKNSEKNLCLSEQEFLKKYNTGG